MYASYPSFRLDFPSFRMVLGSWPARMKAAPQYFRLVNLGKYQHYKHRNPPWIKLHASTLEDYDFGRLQDASKMHLCAIWLLASRTGNKIPWDPEWVAKRINATAEVDLASLQDAGFIELIDVASKVLATCKQSALSETETETESRDREQSPPTGGSLRGVRFKQTSLRKSLISGWLMASPSRSTSWKPRSGPTS